MQNTSTKQRLSPGQKQNQQAAVHSRRLAHWAALESLRAPGNIKTGLQLFRSLRIIETECHNATTAQCNGAAYNGQPFRPDWEDMGFRRVRYFSYFAGNKSPETREVCENMVVTECESSDIAGAKAMEMAQKCEAGKHEFIRSLFTYRTDSFGGSLFGFFVCKTLEPEPHIFVNFHAITELDSNEGISTYALRSDSVLAPDESGPSPWSRYIEGVKMRVARVFGQLPPGFFVNGDARGYALKIDPAKGVVPPGMATDWGSYGLLAATI